MRPHQPGDRLTTATRAAPETVVSAWAPLGRPLYRALWTAALFANVGLWMQNVGAAWLMTSLTPSATLVALVQAAGAGPMVLLGLLAGALADIVDGRRLLVWAQAWMVAVVAGLGLLALVGATTPGTLLLMTFLFGVGVAMSTPAWQVVTLDAVPREELPAAISLNGVSINLARAIGPTVGGVITAVAGVGLMFLLNAVAFVGTLVLLLLSRRETRRSCLPPEHVVQAMQAGARFVRYNPALRAALVRTALFVLAGSALWALLPVVARRELGMSALGYGALLGSLGLGAVAGALILPRVGRRVPVETSIAGASVLLALVTLALAWVRDPIVLGLILIGGGLAWLMLLSLFVVAALATAPVWVRARATAVVFLVFFGGMTVGSVIWGAVAQLVGTPGSLTIASLGLVAGLASAARFPLSGEMPDLRPARHWAEPDLVEEPPPEQGPVLVTVEYRIDPARARDFTRAMRDVRLDRLRNGAMRWELFSDPSEPGRYIETIWIISWAEHQRSHARVTVADSLAEARAKAFHIGDGPTVSTHLVAEPLPDE